MKQISYSYFTALDMRVGKIIKIEDFIKARKSAYKLWIDFGPLGIKKSSARIITLYNKSDLLDRLIIAVVNFPPKQIADFSSEVLVLGVEHGKGRISLLNIDHKVPLGSKVS